MPGVSLPQESYPGGAARCDWHLAEARRIFGEAFDFEPAGCWPSEGAVSQATLEALGRHHFSWTASGSQVLRNSLERSERPEPSYPQLSAWRPAGDCMPACFFRDDGLSDLIGFEYSKWPAEKAVEDFITHIEGRRDESLRAGHQAPVLSIIMDGENAWEYYEQNGWEFLQRLYTRLAEHPELNLATFSGVMERTKPQGLPSLCAGSWVYGNFSTWIGDPAKNRAWDMLVTARHAVDAVLRPFPANERPGWVREVLRQLAICEASDWFWWLREDDQTVDEAAFDSLFREQLADLYRMIGREPPDELQRAIGGNNHEPEKRTDASGTMRRSS
jgi:alpha-amylase/alpha-mannosidase (GH57 family)